MTTSATTSLRQTPRRYPRIRNRLVGCSERLARTLGGRAFYRRHYLARSRLRVRRESIEVPGLARELDGFRIVHLSDIHAGPFLGRGDLADAVALANEQEADLCVLTGDYITRDWREGLEVLEDLGRLQTRHGTLAVFGNHDYHGRCEARFEAAALEHGIVFLRNSARRIEVGGATLHVSGLEDLEESKALDLEGARSELRDGDVEIVLCHNPRGAPALARVGCAAIFAGHSHGAQLDLPWLRDCGPVHPGLRVPFGASVLIVSSGLGVTGCPIRIGSPAELVIAQLVAAERHSEFAR